MQKNLADQLVMNSALNWLAEFPQPQVNWLCWRPSLLHSAQRLSLGDGSALQKQASDRNFSPTGGSIWRVSMNTDGPHSRAFVGQVER